MSIPKTTDAFINKAIKIHGDKYDYSLVDYKGCRVKIKIICKQHGEFLQAPSDHLQHKGCGKCCDNNRLTREDFIKKANIVHNNKYDYQLVNYLNNKIKIKIICSKHGEFLQSAGSHLRGVGCAKCAAEINDNKKRKSTEKFIMDAKKIHGDLYDYSLVNYKQAFERITIICKIHGEFRQIPRDHLNGSGCKHCKNELNKVGKNEKKHFSFYVNNYFKNYEIKQQYPIYKKNNYNYPYLIDFAIPELALAIEYDEKHHRYKTNTQKDKIRQDYIEEQAGLVFIRISDKEFMKNKDDPNYDAFSEKLKEKGIIL